MSSRIRSQLGTLGERTSGVGASFVLVGDAGAERPGLFAGWVRSPEQGWLAHVAWLDEGCLRTGLVPAARVRPVPPSHVPAGGAQVQERPT